MDAASDTLPATTPRPWFRAAAVLLMLIAVAAAFVQKGSESNVAQAGAKRAAAGAPLTQEYKNHVARIIRNARHWQLAGLAAVCLAFASWSVALWRREKLRGFAAILVSLLALYVGLQLMMV